MKKLLLLLIVFVPVFASATTRTVTCSGTINSAFQTAASASLDGDIVAITAGSCSVTTTINMPCTAWTIQGAGSSSTTVTISGSATAIAAGCAGKLQQIAGVKWINTSSANPGLLFLGGTSGSPWSMRFHDNIVIDSGAWHRWLWIEGPCAASTATSGCVFDHNTITNQGLIISAEVSGSGGDGSPRLVPGTSTACGSADNCAGAAQWDKPMGLDNGSEVYFEDNNFVFTNFFDNDMFDCQNGGKYVFRHNTVTSQDVFSHGFDSVASSCIEISAYENTFNNNNGSTTGQLGVLYRGGTGLVYNNRMTGSGVGIHLTNYRSNNSGRNSCPQGYSQNHISCGTSGPGAYCNGNNPADQNLSGQNGYSCFEQIGRGSGTNSWLGGSNSYSFPLYEWDNCTNVQGGGCTGTANQVKADVYNNNGGSVDLTTAQIRQNRDFYDSVSPFTGASGIGVGLISARPVSCTTGVAYWATDQSRLYNCQSTNTWATYYTPFLYPHPLVGGTPAPIFGASPSPVSFGAVNVGSSSSAITVTITNSGTATLTIGTITVTGTNSADFAKSSDTCSGANLAASGGACTLHVTFTPGATGSRTAALNIPDNAGNPDSISMNGTGASPGFSASPSPIAFGSVSVGSSSSATTLTITNNGTANLVIGTITRTGTNPGDFSLSSDLCSGHTVAPSGGTCTLRVTFTPTTTGSRTATVNIPDNVGNPDTVSVSGTGVAPSFSASPNPVAMGLENVGSSTAPTTVTITNNGTASLTIGTITLTGSNPGDFSLSSDVCSGRSIASGGGTCTLRVTFAPTVVGARSATITVPDNAGNPDTISVTGTGTKFTAIPSPIAFGTVVVGSSSPLSVTIRNDGTVTTLTLGTITVTGGTAADYAISSDVCSGHSLGPGVSCTLTLRFTPSTVGSRNATLNVPDNYGNPDTVAITASGSGAAGFQATPSSVAFGNQTVNTSSSAHGVTITNIGTSNLVIGTLSITGTNASNFAKSADTCTAATLIPGATCTVNVTFTPSAAGARSATLTVPDNAGNPDSVPLSGTGTTPTFGASPSPVSFGNISLGSSSPNTTVTISNSGTGQLILGTITITGTNAGDFVKSSDTCSGVTLNSLASCTLQVKFTPGAAGSRSASLNVPDNAGNPDTVSMSGSGIVVLVAPSALFATAQ